MTFNDFSSMKLMKVLLIGIMISFQAGAQVNHFIYLETENKQPFYVRIKERLYSSSASGYLIIPGLIEGNYTLTIGFPKNEYPTFDIDVKLGNKDAGYLIKNIHANSWGLYNLQTMEMLQAGIKDSAQSIYVNKTDDFSTVLSAVVNTPVQGTGAGVNDSTVVRQTDSSIGFNKKPEQMELNKKSTGQGISKWMSTLDDNGRSMVFLIKDGAQTDTLAVFIPYVYIDHEVQVPLTVINVQETIKEEQFVQQPAKINMQQTEIKDSLLNNKNGNIDQKENKENANKFIVPAKTTENESSKKEIVHTVCKTIATDDDFLKLRKKMAAESSEDDMVFAARKIFRMKCFSTAQLKNLVVLFLKEEGRYHFLDAAYPFTSDPANFIHLQSLLSDEYYIKRFKAMIR